MKKGGGSESTIISRSIQVCSGLRAPQLRIRPRPCPISGIRGKIILYYIKVVITFTLTGWVLYFEQMSMTDILLLVSKKVLVLV